MTPHMIEALTRLSAFCDPDPNVLLNYIVRLLADCYEGSMTMVNVVQGDRLVFRAVANRIPALDDVSSLPLAESLCMDCVRARRPMVIQDAATSARHRRLAVVGFGMRRHLAVPILDPRGECIGTVCFLDDRAEAPITEGDVRLLSIVAMRVSAELERERAMHERAEEQRVINARLEAAAEEKRAFVGMVLHDLGHPLTAIKASLFLAERHIAAPAPHQAEVRTIAHQVGALERLVQSLRLVDQMDRDTAVLSLARVRPADLIADCIAVLAPLAEHYGLRLECELARDLGARRMDADKISHILYNLVSNALRFTPDGVVRVCAGPLPDNAWWLEVHDTGPGVAARYDGVTQDGREPSRRGGSGLGLTIVRRLCALLEAEMEVRSAPGRGTSVRITFVSRCSAGAMTRYARAGSHLDAA